MSDLITTTQDTFRDKSIDAYFGARSMIETLVERAKDPRGQTAAEYMGILLVVSVIIAAIVATPLGTNLAKRVGDLVGMIGRGESGK